MLSVDELYKTYKSDIERIVSQVAAGGEASIPIVLTEILTQVLPSMMRDVGRVKKLSGREKRQLIIDTLTLALKESFDALNESVDAFKDSGVDELVLSILLSMVPSTIRLLVDVEKKRIVFNKKLASCCGCL